MNQEFKAIPSKYNGIEFRSRLEARWAVFLDIIGIKYFYEQEGYQLKSGWYLPDFYLPDLMEQPIYIEIKPKFPDRREANFCAELALATKNKVVCFYGNIESQDTAPRADTYGKSVIKKTLEGPNSISFDHKTLFWRTKDPRLTDELPVNLKKMLSKYTFHPFWKVDNEFLYWCQCSCCHKITLKPRGIVSPAICGDACKFWHDEATRKVYIDMCKKHAKKQFVEAYNGLGKDEWTAAGATWFYCTRSSKLLEAFNNAQKHKFWG